MSLSVFYKYGLSVTDTAVLESIRKDAKDFVHSVLDQMCGGKDITLDEINTLIEDARLVNYARFSSEEPKLIESYEDAIKGDELCWIEDAWLYPAKGDKYSDPTDSGEDEFIFEIRACFKFGGCLYDEAGIGELEKVNYNKIIREKDGTVCGFRVWTGGKMPTIEQRKAAKWEGLKEYTDL